MTMWMKARGNPFGYAWSFLRLINKDTPNVHLLLPRLIKEVNGFTKARKMSTRNINKVIKRQYDACSNIQLPDDAERQLRLVFKQFSEKKHIKGTAIDVVHMDKIRKVRFLLHWRNGCAWRDSFIFRLRLSLICKMSLIFPICRV